MPLRPKLFYGVGSVTRYDINRRGHESHLEILSGGEG
jgi:hypothetical protein